MRHLDAHCSPNLLRREKGAGGLAHVVGTVLGKRDLTRVARVAQRNDLLAERVILSEKGKKMTP